MLKYNALIKLMKDFNALVEMDLDDFSNKNIDLDKLLFNANCRTYKLNKEVHNLKGE